MAVRSNSKGFERRRRSNLGGSILIACAVVVAAFILNKSQKPVQKVEVAAPVVAEFDAVKLPVPSEPVPAGTRVRDIKFHTVAFPKHQVPVGALQSLDTIIEAAALAPLPADLPLFQANFTSSVVTKNPVLEKIPPGMRAMTIRVDATSAVEGWAGSGSVVDVILVERDRSSVVAEKVKILSAERSVSPVEGSSAPSVPSTVTLLVTQEQCLAINTAIPLGRIAFALRSTRDDESWSDGVYTAERLKGGPVQEAKNESASGYVSYRDSSGAERKMALFDRKWIPSQVKPEGFFPGQAAEAVARGAAMINALAPKESEPAGAAPQQVN